MIPPDELVEVEFEGRPAGYMVLRECDDATWAWCWQRPDTTCEHGLEDNAEAAADRLAIAVKAFYDAAH